MAVSVAKEIKEARTKAGLTQVELARRLSVTQGYISQCESGLKDGMSVRQFSRILNACSPKRKRGK